MNTRIKAYELKHRDEMISIWERSVRATHDFVRNSDIDYFKSLVEQIDFTSFEVYCLVKEEKVLGFIGVLDRCIEMLFLDPVYIGKGLGKKLMQFALSNLKANKVDVNEQNVNAVAFYSKFGFVAYERMEKDPHGKDYPILKMKIKND
jgi:putative acetyltransferase